MFVMSRYSFSSYSHHRIFLVSNRAKWQRLLMTPLFVLERLSPGGGTPGNSWWGCAPRPFSDQTSKIHTRFQF